MSIATSATTSSVAAEFTVATFRSGDGLYCQDRPASQYDMAMAVLTDPNKDVKVVTINLGADDLFRHQDACYAMAATGEDPA